MSRSSPWIMVGFFVAGCLTVVGYSRLTRDEPTAVEAPRALAAASPTVSAAPSPSPQSEALPSPAEPLQDEDDTSAPETAKTPEAVRRLAADAMSEDAGARATAIAALGDAPKDTALPVLKRVLTGGDPQMDRPLALSALRTLAIHQGDADGRIRDVLRQTVSHADSETLASGAQTVLDEVEQLY